MTKLKLSAIYMFPIKSLQEVSLNSTRVFGWGITYDRRWMLVNKHGEYQSLKKVAELAKFGIDLDGRYMKISHPDSSVKLRVPVEISEGRKMQVRIMNDFCDAIIGSQQYDRWFSDILQRETHLVYITDESLRMVNPKYAGNDEKVGFANNYPLMMIGQASLDDLNTRLKEPVVMERFRPNLVFTGGKPFEEDEFSEFEIGDCLFKAVKPCARCVVINVEPGTGITSPDPLKTLGTYRTFGKDINMGQNLLCIREGKIEVGQELCIKSRRA